MATPLMVTTQYKSLALKGRKQEGFLYRPFFQYPSSNHNKPTSLRFINLYHYVHTKQLGLSKTHNYGMTLEQARRVPSKSSTTKSFNTYLTMGVRYFNVQSWLRIVSMISLSRYGNDMTHLVQLTR